MPEEPGGIKGGSLFHDLTHLKSDETILVDDTSEGHLTKDDPMKQRTLKARASLFANFVMIL